MNGGHVSAALWFVAAAWQAKGATRVVGLLLALVLGSYSLLPHAPIALLIPSGPLLPLWFALVGRALAQSMEPRRGQSEGGEQHRTREPPSYSSGE